MGTILENLKQDLAEAQAHNGNLIREFEFAKISKAASELILKEAKQRLANAQSEYNRITLQAPGTRSWVTSFLIRKSAQAEVDRIEAKYKAIQSPVDAHLSESASRDRDKALARVEDLYFQINLASNFHQ